jgi:hypothetical protein
VDTARPARGLLIVTGLALVAGAISFDHMRELANQHSQLGWRSLAFPVSVDGLEVVASLYLVAQRRVGRPPGWAPWTALVVGTLASLAANVAVGGHDLIGRALAGWPALSMLASVKLFFGMFDHTSLDSRAGTTAGPSRTINESSRTINWLSRTTSGRPPGKRCPGRGARHRALTPAKVRQFGRRHCRAPNRRSPPRPRNAHP